MALYPYFPVLTVRWPGVLQRIGVCYLAAWAAKRWLRPRGQAVLAACLLVGYWALMTKVDRARGPPAEPRDADEPLGAGGPHRPRPPRLERDEDVGPRGRPLHPARDRHDAPGPALRGVGAVRAQAVRDDAGPPARRARAHRARRSLGRGGARRGSLFPINKSIWTSSFVLLTGGLAAALFGLTYWVVDVAGWKRWAAPFVTYGKNAIAVFVGSGLLAKTLLSIKWPDALRRGGEPLAAPLRGALRELAPALRGLARLGGRRWSSSSTSSPSGWTAGASTSRSDERGPSRHHAGRSRRWRRSSR